MSRIGASEEIELTTVVIAHSASVHGVSLTAPQSERHMAAEAFSGSEGI